MNHKIAAGLVAAAASALLAGTAHAQIPNITPFSVEVRGGAAQPLGDDFSEDVSTGYTFGGNVGFQALPLIGVYAGYTRNVFSPSDDIQEEIGDGDVSISGLNAGVRLGIPTPLIPIDPFVKAGAVYYKLESSGFQEEDANFESESSLGFEVGAGVGFNILPKVQLTPALTYTGFRFEADGGEDDKVDANHLRLDVGLRIRI